MHEISPFLIFTEKLNGLRMRYMVTGSVAATMYGEPRLTHDIDVVVVLERPQISALRQAFPEQEFYCPSAEVITLEASRAQRGHFNIIHRKSGNKADVFLSVNDAFPAWGLARATILKTDGSQFFVAPPEYVIVRKLEYYREGGSQKHLRDIRSMLELSGKVIDHAELERQILARGLREAWDDVQQGRGQQHVHAVTAAPAYNLAKMS